MNLDIAQSYAAIIKQEKQADGTLKVYGKATDDSIDIDQQICDEAWLKKAMPDWFTTGGNVREQHSNIAAGVATEYEAKEDGHYITALVVDPTSVKKVETGVLKGFSIGIRGPRVVRDNKAAGGRIVDGQIVEISLVDRPANSNAKLMLAKASATGELEAVRQVTIPSPAVLAEQVNKFNENHDDAGRFSSGDGGGSSRGIDQAQEGIDGVRAAMVASRYAEQEGTNPVNGIKAEAETRAAQDHVNQARTAHAAGDTETAHAHLEAAANNMRNALGFHDLHLNQTPAARETFRAVRGNVIGAIVGQQNYRDDNGIKAGAIGLGNNKSTDADLAKTTDPNQTETMTTDINKFNENHDEAGRFSSGDSAGGGYQPSARMTAVSTATDDVDMHLRDLANLKDRVGSEKGSFATGMAERASEIAYRSLGNAKNEEAKGNSTNSGGHLANAAEALSQAAGYLDRTGEPTLVDKANEIYATAGQINAHLSGNKSVTGDLNKSVKAIVGDLMKFDQTQYDAAITAISNLITVESNEMKNGSNEIDSIKELLRSVKHLQHWYEGEVEEGEVPGVSPDSDDDANSVLNLSTMSETEKADSACKCDCASCGDNAGCDADICKCSTTTEKSVTLNVDADQEISIIEKAIASAREAVNTEIEQLKAAQTAAEQTASQLRAELDEALSKAAVGGPKRTINKATTPAEINEYVAKAADYRAKANLTDDRVLAEGYKQLAEDFEKKARKARKGSN